MIRRNEAGDLMWGPGHIASLATTEDPGLWAHVAGSFIEAALSKYKTIEQREHALTEGKLEVDHEDPAPDSEALVLPFLFDARQGVELLLKVLVLCRRRLDANVQFIDGHFLGKIWCEARPIFRTIPDGADGQRERDLDQLVDLLATVDFNGQEIRYPANKPRTSFTQAVAGHMVGVPGVFGGTAVIAVADVNLSLIARLIDSTRILLYTTDVVEDLLRSTK